MHYTRLNSCHFLIAFEFQKRYVVAYNLNSVAHMNVVLKLQSTRNVGTVVELGKAFDPINTGN